MSPQLIFGTASLGMDGTEFQEASSVLPLLQLLKKRGIGRVDSAARYPPLNPGRSEQLLGECLELSSGLMVDTKVYADMKTDGSGELTREAIQTSLRASLSRLRRASVNILHIHRADPSTPVHEQVRAFSEQIDQGLCQGWGVSNVPLPMLREMLRVCEEEHLHKPVCYQGPYNIITRAAEAELLSLLREHNVHFNAFGPLASGFMTGNFVKGNHAGTRFGDDNPLGKVSQKMFGNNDLHQAMKEFDMVVTDHKLTTKEVALRWILYHSALSDEDGIIFGASRQGQIIETLDLLQGGSLPDEVLKSAERLWQVARENRGQII